MIFELGRVWKRRTKKGHRFFGVNVEPVEEGGIGGEEEGRGGGRGAREGGG